MRRRRRTPGQPQSQKDAVVDRDGLELLLAEQIAYYRALAGEYGEHALDLPGGEELLSALNAFQPEGDVLEIACGPGFWTGRLLRHATTVTSLDAAAEMLAIASARIDDERVRFIQADVFSWRPDRRYDVVFFGFWLSHVPAERFESFWPLIGDCLVPHGRVFFADDRHRTAEELIEGERSSTIQRRLNDGTAYRAVKVPHTASELELELLQAGERLVVVEARRSGSHRRRERARHRSQRRSKTIRPLVGSARVRLR